MRPLRTLTAACTCASVALSFLVMAAAPAQALEPVLNVTVAKVTGGFKACAWGVAADAGGLLLQHWSFDIDGARSNGTTIQSSYTLDWVWNFASETTPYCVTVTKNWPSAALNLAGGFSASLSLVSGSTDAVSEVSGTGTWDPVEGDQVTSMSSL